MTRRFQGSHTRASVGMARWVGETTLETLELPVTIDVALREVTLEAAQLRSPGGTKPMRRSYTYVSTPDVARYDDKLAKNVHEKNLAERGIVEAEFEKAAAEQPRIEARRRDATRRARNVLMYGCARGVPAAKRKAAETPVTADGKAQHARMDTLPCLSEHEASAAPVEKELAWDGC